MNQNTNRRKFLRQSTEAAATEEDRTGKLQRFAIAGADKQWRWEEARIDGDSVICSHPDVMEPIAIRYAFSMNPAGANLYNRDGLPASPFRTDEWSPVRTMKGSGT
jgi:sialate O-acetylesterase